MAVFQPVKMWFRVVDCMTLLIVNSGFGTIFSGAAGLARCRASQTFNLGQDKPVISCLLSILVTSPVLFFLQHFSFPAEGLRTVLIMHHS
jgi:hypothetical protein